MRWYVNIYFQFADVLLPEIQEMFAKLPENSDLPYNIKYGWLPSQFIDHCREIVNAHVLEAVKQNMTTSSQDTAEKSEASNDRRYFAEYCSEILNNLKMGSSTSNLQIKTSTVQTEDRKESDNRSESSDDADDGRLN